MVGDIFNNGREPWEVRLGREEVFSFLRLVETLPPRPGGDRFFCECRPDGTRIWHHIDQLVAVSHRTTGERTDARRILAFSEAALIGVANLFGWEEECTVHTGEDGVALVARTLDRAFMWELPPIDPNIENHLVPVDSDGWESIAVLEGSVFRQVTRQSSLQPRRLPRVPVQLYPYVTFAFIQGELRVVLDQRRAGGLRMALAVPAATTIETEINLPAQLLDHFSGVLDTDHDVDVQWHEDYSFVRFASGSTTLHIRLWHEDSVRWWDVVTDALIRLDCEIDGSGKGRTRNIPFTLAEAGDEDGAAFEGVATIISRESDRDDRVRLSTLLVAEVPESPAAMREVLEIAATVCDVALSLEGRSLWATIDVPLSANLDLGSALTALLRAADETRDIGLLLEIVS
jgi:hypothetical protein